MQSEVFVHLYPVDQVMGCHQYPKVLVDCRLQLLPLCLLPAAFEVGKEVAETTSRSNFFLYDPIVTEFGLGLLYAFTDLVEFSF
jgi:hypothetical protein